MGSLIPIKYGTKNYPPPIDPKIQEIPGHFDIDTKRTRKKIKILKQANKNFSLHTEYSYKERNFNCSLIQNKTSIRSSNYKGVPLLWKSEEWTKEFADFIVELCMESEPAIIEIHPPFKNYSNLEKFIKHYKIFEDLIAKKYPNTKILIENRNTSKYSKRSEHLKLEFLISDLDDLQRLADFISKEELKLRIVLDIPQLFGRLGGIKRISIEKLTNIFNTLKKLHDFIDGFHIWGIKDRIPHTGDLNSYFKDNSKKQHFLVLFSEFISNSPKDFYFVPEVNSNEKDLNSIINDLIKAGIKFK